MQFIPQSTATDYVQSVALDRHIPMRANNWHDFFNNITWLAWPKTKWQLYQRYLSQGIAMRERTREQNMLALFDECGAIIASTDHDVFEQIKNFEFKKIFFIERRRLENARVFTFGHGLLEKYLSPYIGMTAKALFVKVPDVFLRWSKLKQIQYLDTAMASHFEQASILQTKDLHPLPILGWPGWWPNQDAAFYGNTHYFRPERSGRLKSLP